MLQVPSEKILSNKLGLIESQTGTKYAILNVYMKLGKMNILYCPYKSNTQEKITFKNGLLQVKKKPKNNLYYS